MFDRTADEGIFLEAVLADRGNVGPRQVFGDWLLEQGDPRGEFIQVQCRLAELGPFDPLREELVASEQQLLKKHGADWRRSVKEFVTAAEFRRGFVEHVAADLGTFVERADELLELEPIRSVKIHGDRGRIAELANCPALERLEVLSLTSMNLRAESYGPLFGSPHLGNLVELDLSHNTLGRAGMQALAGCSSLGRLRRLGLNKTGIKGPAAKSLAAWPLLGNLTHLDLRENAVRAADFAALADSGGLANVETLLLGENGFLDDAAAVALAGTGCRPRVLQFALNTFGPVGLAAVVAGGLLERVESLTLKWNRNIGPQGAGILARANLPRLESLSLYRCGLGDEGGSALLAAPWLVGLRALNLFDNDFTDVFANALAEARLPNLHALVLGSNGFSNMANERVRSAHPAAVERGWPEVQWLER